MPLARIVTRFPESSSAASDFFRSHGYTVEVVDPGDFRVTPAVLELKLGRCTPDEALLRAQEALANLEQNKESSGSLTDSEPIEEQGEAIAYDIAGRPVQFADRRKTPSSFRGALISLLRRAWEDTGSRLPDALRAVGIGGSKSRQADAVTFTGIGPANRSSVAPPMTSHEPSPEADNLARAAAEWEAAEREQRARIAAREAEERERVRLQQETEAAAERERQRIAAAAREAELARQREQERLAAQRAAQERARVHRENEAAAERERQRIAAERAAELARRREQQNSATERAREERARLLREAEASAERERQRIAAMRDVELARRREQQAVTAQRSIEEQARLRAAGELAIRRERDRVLAQQALPGAERKPPEPKPVSDSDAPKTSAEPTVLPPKRMWPRQVEDPQSYRRRNTDLPPAGWERSLNPVRETEWKKAFAAAGVVTILATAGIIAFANRRPAEPLSPADVSRSQAIDQRTPFGSATIAPAPAATPQPVKPAPAVVPALQKPAPTHPEINHSASAPRRRTNNTTGGRLRRLAPEEDQVAEDEVVVRHFQKPQPILKSSARAGGIKQISDIR